nr:MAG TPA: hypothetical protein [Caudoviricetes sp.]
MPCDWLRLGRFRDRWERPLGGGRRPQRVDGTPRIRVEEDVRCLDAVPVDGGRGDLHACPAVQGDDELSASFDEVDDPRDRRR